MMRFWVVVVLVGVVVGAIYGGLLWLLALVRGR